MTIPFSSSISSNSICTRPLCIKDLLRVLPASELLRVGWAWLCSALISVSTITTNMELVRMVFHAHKLTHQRNLKWVTLSYAPDIPSSCMELRNGVTTNVTKFSNSKRSRANLKNSRLSIEGRPLLEEPNGEPVDCSACGSSGYAISGDLNLLENLIMKTDARYIIVVEKHAIFHRLVEDRVFNQIPSILITAKGYPDIATRFLLHRMSRAFPDLPIFALVDWNPAGLAILCTFKFGSIGMGLEAYRYACNVKWLGLRGDDLQMIPEQSLVPLKPRDLQIAKSLMSSEILQEKYREELALMVQSGQRAEIEALYYHGYDYLGKYMAKKIVQANYI
ncbi:hypothetical protein JRO89_XS13G0156300 [Xanthoceras sorbifolium]|uniref:Topoisomerase 6 subunit A/Spo11 TOPRIM domain-containing protein n=1 Tax=Xanthoceras sorbifolium TaxID=99658 RepID=A0ABQ8H8K2_9ROSI|nr:hypothetical protein JRO89_XS13G0156300 [Xanthoceras sorbifolium]